jgi:hypothetical protein
MKRLDATLKEMRKKHAPSSSKWKEQEDDYPEAERASPLSSNSSGNGRRGSPINIVAQLAFGHDAEAWAFQHACSS